MEQAERLQELTIPLLQWFQENARRLPWREDVTPYRVWVSEIMLQQTRVAAVIDYFNRFMSVLPDVAQLASVSEDELFKLWQGLGYYNRARNLQKGARQIMAQYGGVFPNRYDEILALSGVGEYTAGAIASIAFGQSVPAVDGNVLRVLARILGDTRDITNAKTKTAMRQLLTQVIPVDAPGAYNQALMELGATVCLPNGAPLCSACPVKGNCIAANEDQWSRIPVKSAKKPRKIERRRVLLIFHNGCVALRRRPSQGLLGGLWEYPNETEQETALLNRWMTETDAVQPIAKGRHIFTHIEWHMEAFSVCVTDDALPEGWTWANARELAQIYAVPSAFSFVSNTVLTILDKWEVAQ